MSTAVPPTPSEVTPARLSEPQRIANAFFAPSRTFEDIRHNASWWVPWLLGSIIAAAFFFTVDKKIGFETIAKNQMENAGGFAQRAMERLTPEQRSQALHRQAIGLAQHHTMDVFEPIAVSLPLQDIGTLDELATELFAV